MFPYQGNNQDNVQSTKQVGQKVEVITWMNQVGKQLLSQRSKIEMILIICLHGPNSLYNCSNHVYLLHVIGFAMFSFEQGEERAF